jgi:hypothetical protein
VSSGAAQVDEATLGKKDNVAAGCKGETVNLGLDIDDLLGVLLQPSDVDFNIKVADAVLYCSVLANLGG